MITNWMSAGWIWRKCRFYSLVFAAGLVGCIESIDHNATLAGKQAEEFAQVAFVKRDLENGYALLADGARRYVSREQFKAVVAKLHPEAYPKNVRASEYEPMPGEKAIYIFLTGENSGERFYYRLTLEGTATTPYRVLRFDRANEPYPPSSEKKKIERTTRLNRGVPSLNISMSLFLDPLTYDQSHRRLAKV